MNIDTNEIIHLIIDTAPIWSTALVSIIGVVLTIVKGLNKVKDAVDDMRADKTLKDVSERLSAVLAENERLIKQQNVLIDRITHIENYMEAKEHERKK